MARRKNKFLKERPLHDPYEIWVNQEGWEWRVLKKWQIDDDKPFARWMCAVKSPMTYGEFEIGDVYVRDITTYGIKLMDEDVKHWIKQSNP